VIGPQLVPLVQRMGEAGSEKQYPHLTVGAV
jgi:hypothetical protein